MNFSKYILCCVCMGAVFVPEGNSAYSGEDPEIEKLKETIQKDEAKQEAAEAETKKISTLIEEVKADNQKTTKEMSDKQADLSAKLQELEKKTQEGPGDPKEINDLKASTEKTDKELSDSMQALNAKMQEAEKELDAVPALQASVQNLEKKAQETPDSSVEINGLKEEFNKLKTDVQNSPAAALDPNTKTMIDDMGKRLDALTKEKENQDVESAKTSARLDKVEKQVKTQTLAQTASGLSGLLGPATKGVSGLLSSMSKSKKIDVSKIASGEQTGRDATPEEKAVIQAIQADLKSGKSIQDIEQNLKKLSTPRFQHITYYGVNEIFSVKATIPYIVNQAQNQVPPDDIVKSVSNEAALNSEKSNTGSQFTSNDEDIVKTICDFVTRGADVSDIKDNLKFIYTGKPGKTIRTDSSVLQTADDEQVISDSGNTSTVQQQYNNVNSQQQGAQANAASGQQIGSTPGSSQSVTQQGTAVQPQGVIGQQQQSPSQNVGTQQQNAQTGSSKNKGKNGQAAQQQQYNPSGVDQVGQQQQYNNVNNQQQGSQSNPASGQQIGSTPGSSQSVQQQGVIGQPQGVIGQQQQSPSQNVGTQQQNAQTGSSKNKEKNGQAAQQQQYNPSGIDQVGQQQQYNNVNNQQQGSQSNPASGQQIGSTPGSAGVIGQPQGAIGQQQQGVIGQPQGVVGQQKKNPSANNIGNKEKIQQLADLMTVVDISNNMYYDVERGKFMAIATPSTAHN